MEASVSQVLCCKQLTMASLSREAFIKGHQEAVSLKENENQVSALRGQKQHLKSQAKMLLGRNTGLGTDSLLSWESGCKLPSPAPAQILPPLCQ